MVAIDGTRLAGNTSRGSNRDFGQIAREILAEAKATDEAEDELYGDARGDELPEPLRTREGRREFFRQARERRAAQDSDADEPSGPESEPAAEALELDAELIVARGQGREGWVREARRQLEARRWQAPDPIARGRVERLLLAAERMEEDLDAQLAGNRAYERYRATGRDTKGRHLGRRPNPWVAPEVPDAMVSVTDPDSRHIKANEAYVQGYNAQAVVDENQIVLAAEITNSTVDFSQLAPMITAALGELDRAGVTDRPQIAVADAQYWNEQHMDRGGRRSAHPGPDPARLRRSHDPASRLGRRALRSDAQRAGLPAGQAIYRRRKQMIEPVFAHTKHNRQVTRFLRRGRAAVRAEWRLLMTTHNLTKLHRHHLAALAA